MKEENGSKVSEFATTPETVTSSYHSVMTSKQPPSNLFPAHLQSLETLPTHSRLQRHPYLIAGDMIPDQPTLTIEFVKRIPEITGLALARMSFLPAFVPKGRRRLT